MSRPPLHTAITHQPKTPPMKTSDDIPAGPFSEHELREQWNCQADKYNQWDSLDSCEQLSWAQARAIAAYRAALAEADGPAVPEGRKPASVVGEPSDEEIMGLMPQQMHDDLAAAVRAMAEQGGIDSTRAKGVMRIMLNRHVVDLARAVLARFGPQPAPPAEGEVEP